MTTKILLAVEEGMVTVLDRRAKKLGITRSALIRSCLIETFPELKKYNLKQYSTKKSDRNA